MSGGADDESAQTRSNHLQQRRRWNDRRLKVFQRRELIRPAFDYGGTRDAAGTRRDKRESRKVRCGVDAQRLCEPAVLGDDERDNPRHVLPDDAPPEGEVRVVVRPTLTRILVSSRLERRNRERLRTGVSEHPLHALVLARRAARPQWNMGPQC